MTKKNLLLGLLLLSACTHKRGPDADWPVYGGNKAGNRYSTLKQINLDNVRDLTVAWTYDASDIKRGETQCQPIEVNGVLYGTNSRLKLFALDAATGKRLWEFDPFRDTIPFFHQSRGLAYWEGRILYSAGVNLYEVDATTGRAVKSFGASGKVNLHDGLSLNYDASPLFVDATSPGIVYKDLFIMGNTVSESGDAAPGYVRAFDLHTGKIRWIFHPMPQPGEPGYDTWSPDAYKKIGASNAWSGITLDEKRGAVYFGTGSPASDFYGGERKGMNQYANSVVALDAATGRLKWAYQVIHHDLWDRDMPCPPNLATIRRDGHPEDVVVQATKDGNVYVLDRDSGTSVFPVEERPVPTQGLPGESPWPTQRYPVKPLPFCAQDITDSDITNISPAAHAYVKNLFDSLEHGNKFLPPSTRGTLLVGYSGGAEWGGNAVDSGGILYQNSNNALWILQMISRSDLQKQMAALSEGKGLYVANCASCHGMNRMGNGKEIPSLVNIATKLKTEELAGILKNGQGRMPSFQNLLSDDQRVALIHFLQNANIRVGAEHRERDSLIKKTRDFPYVPPYVSKVWDKLTDQDGYPAIKPPWGTLNAINLNTGDYLWRVPLGEYPELTKKGVPITGTESYGGPLATAGGLVFIAGTRDEKIRAFDQRTGKVVWEYQLPAGGFATPITYEVDGKQYVVIAAGGARGLKPGGSYIAFALPEKDIQ